MNSNSNPRSDQINISISGIPSTLSSPHFLPLHLEEPPRGNATAGLRQSFNLTSEKCALFSPSPVLPSPFYNIPTFLLRVYCMMMPRRNGLFYHPFRSPNIDHRNRPPSFSDSVICTIFFHRRHRKRERPSDASARVSNNFF